MTPLAIDAIAEACAPGRLIAIPPDYSGVSMAATRAMVARGCRDLRLLAVPSSGMQADILIGAGCVGELEAAAITLGEAGPAPRFTAAVLARTIAMRDTTCPAIHAALQASEKGIPFMPLRGLIGSDLVARRDDWRVADNPFGNDDPIVFLPAIRPDIALFHAAKADSEGNVWIGRRRELATMAHAARETFVTVEAIVPGSFFDDEDMTAGVLPALYVTGVAPARFGAAPIGLGETYPPDEPAIARYAKMARDEAGFRVWLDGFLASRSSAA